MQGEADARITSLVWCRTGYGGCSSGRMFSSSVDGAIYEWDIFRLRQKTVLESIGVSIWQMAVSPRNDGHLTQCCQKRPRQTPRSSGEARRKPNPLLCQRRAPRKRRFPGARLDRSIRR